ncbi:MAE_28990/MAE_18760 family HEPN-like nuclease [Micromonospora palomenae]|nr:MAE_28990/MAE_18760 family HEPN-like nuclease [Micromonospora palomenae]
MAQYATQLVLLYGAFERLIEGLVAGTVQTLNELVPSMDDLPERLKDNHRRKSLEALRDEVWLTRMKDPMLSVRLIENLHSCESKAGNYRLNALAYARHAGNFRRKTIDEAFREVGIDDFLKLVVGTKDFVAYLAASGHSSGNLGADLGAIDDLADRRNEIAHGSPAALLTRDEIREYLQFFNAFARAAYAILRQHLGSFLVKHHAVPFRGTSQLHYNSVICLDLGILPEGTLLQVGDPLAVDVGLPSGYQLGRMLTIRTSNGDVQKIRSHAGAQVCLETSCQMKRIRSLYLVDRECPASWLADSLPST